jgi:hypothetical protein
MVSDSAVIVAPVCPTCGATAQLVDSAVIYHRTNIRGWIWRCPTPACDTYVGAHSDGRPLGTLAGRSLRAARKRAHIAFDGWWRAHGIRRVDAYRELARVIGREEAHIGEMDEAECARVVEIFSGR